MDAPPNQPIETLEGLLEHARQNGQHVKLVLGGRIDQPVDAVVRARNGSTFELAVGAIVLRMDVAQIVLRTA